MTNVARWCALRFGGCGTRTNSSFQSSRSTSLTIFEWSEALIVSTMTFVGLYPDAPQMPSTSSASYINNATQIAFTWKTPSTYGLPIIMYQMQVDGAVGGATCTGVSTYNLNDLWPLTAHQHVRAVTLGGHGRPHRQQV